MIERRPAEIFPVGAYLSEELEARGWTIDDLVAQMPAPGEHVRAALAFTLQAPIPGIWLSVELAQQIADALGMSAETWIAIDCEWQKANVLG